MSDSGNVRSQDNVTGSKNTFKNYTYGGTLKLFCTNPDTMNPVLTTNTYVRKFASLIFESMVKIDKNQKPVPCLAKGWEVSEDGLTWNFYLNENILWHDDSPFSADDVVFTLDTIRNSAGLSVYQRNLENVLSYAAIDSYTLEIKLNTPDSFTPLLMSFPIVKKIDVSEGGEYKGSFEPVGTGPYRLSEYGDSSIILARNENWWQKSNGQIKGPYFDNVEIKIYGGKEEEAVAFLKGETDIALVDRGEVEKYYYRPDITVRRYPSNEFEFIAFNFNNSALAEKTVRQAIAYAIDRKSIIDNVLSGEAIAAEIPVIPDTWLYNSNTIVYNVDKKKAKELLLQDGWEESNGVMSKKIAGVKTVLSFNLLVNSDNSLRREVAQKIADDIAEIGIKVEITEVSWDSELAMLASGSFDMALLGCTIPVTLDLSYLYSSEKVGASSGSNYVWNISGYKNDEVDSCLKKILAERDEYEQKVLFFNMKNIIIDDVPYFGLYFYNDAVLYNMKLDGELNPYTWNVYNDMVKWYVKSE